MSGIITADIPGHGTKRIRAKDLDWAIDHLLPASPAVLRSLYEEWSGKTLPSEERLTVSELLILLVAENQGEAP